jgi:hypothetical protein
MADTIHVQISPAVAFWAREIYQTAGIVMGDIGPDGDDPPMPNAA